MLSGFPGGSLVKKFACNAGDMVLIPELERSQEKEMAIHSKFLSGKSHGGKILVGYSPWGCKDSGCDLGTKPR